MMMKSTSTIFDLAETSTDATGSTSQHYQQQQQQQHHSMFNDVVGFNVTQNANDTGDITGWPAIEAIDKFVTPVWYVIGIPGNIVAYIVWIQRRMRPSSGCYLAALALDECLFLVLQMLYELETRWEVTLLQLPGLCEVFPILFLTTQYLSPLLVLGFTVERYISVCHPFKREHYCTTRRAVITITALVFMTLGVHAVQGYFWKFYPTASSLATAANDTRSDGGVPESLSSMFVGECRIRPEVMAAGTWSVWSVWSWVTEMAVFGLVPLTILLLNILVIRETRLLSASDARRCLKVMTAHADVPNEANVAGGLRKQVSGHRGAGSGRSATGVSTNGSGCNSGAAPATFRPSATTVMLLAVSFYLIATTLPVTICYVLYLSFPEGDHTLPVGEERWSDTTWSRHYIYRGVRTVVEEFGMSHYACNLYIYLATGRIFRRELCQLIGRRGNISNAAVYLTDGGSWRRTTRAGRREGEVSGSCRRDDSASTQRREAKIAARWNHEEADGGHNSQRQPKQLQQQQQQQVSVTISKSSTCHGLLMATTSCTVDTSDSYNAAGLQLLLSSDKTALNGNAFDLM